MEKKTHNEKGFEETKKNIYLLIKTYEKIYKLPELEMEIFIDNKKDIFFIRKEDANDNWKIAINKSKMLENPQEIIESLSVLGSDFVEILEEEKRYGLELSGEKNCIVLVLTDEGKLIVKNNLIDQIDRALKDLGVEVDRSINLK